MYQYSLNTYHNIICVAKVFFFLTFVLNDTIKLIRNATLPAIPGGHVSAATSPCANFTTLRAVYVSSHICTYAFCYFRNMFQAL